MSRMLLAALIFAAATPALAQTVATAPASVAPPVQAPVGPPLPGVCLLGQQAAIANSKVGQMASKRLQQLVDEAVAQYKTARQPLAAAEQSLQAETKLSQAEYLQRAQALQAQIQKVEATREQRGRQIEALSQQAMGKIATSEQPLLTPIYTAHHCSLLLSRDVVLGGNMSGDLTPEVVASMDANLTNISLDLPGAAPTASAAPAEAPKPAATGKKKK
jgi:Skp family chaperone for outer membrane proteins